MSQLFLDFQLIALGLVAILNAILGLYIFSRDPKNRLHQIFLFLVISLVAWCLATFFNIFFYTNVAIFDLFERTTFISGMFIGLAFYLFALFYPYRAQKLPKVFITLYSLLIIFFVFVTFYTSWFVLDTTVVNDVTTTHHNDYWYIFWAVSLTVPFVLALIRLWQNMKHSDGVYRSHFVTLFVVVGVTIVLSFYFDVLLVGLEQYRYNAIGPYFSLLFIFAIMRMIISKE